MKFNWISAIAIMLMLASLVVALFIYYKDEVNKCTSNPLVYASQKYERDFGYEFIGSGSFVLDKGVSPIVNFNSENVTVVELPY